MSERFDGGRLLTEMTDRLEATSMPLVEYVLIHNHVVVRVNPDQYQSIESAIPIIEDQLKTGLETWRDGRNRTSVWERMSGRAGLPYVLAPDSSFIVKILPDTEGTLPVGKVSIETGTATQPPGGIAGGESDDTDQTDVIGSESDRTVPIGGGAAAGAASSPAAASRPAARVTVMTHGARSEKIVRKPEFKIGRGGTSFVDVRVNDQHVSRVHLEVRRNGHGFEARDTSAYGSSMAGQAMPKNQWCGLTGAVELVPGVSVEVEEIAA